MVCEDVWGPALQALAADVSVDRRPDAWAEPESLPDLLAGAAAVAVLAGASSVAARTAGG